MVDFSYSGLVLLLAGISVQCVVRNSSLVPYPLEHKLDDTVDWVRIPTPADEWIWTHRHSVGAMMQQHRSSLPAMNIGFLLYTRRDTSDEGHRLELQNVDSLLSSNFNPAHPTRIIVHGWQNDKNSPIAQSIRDTYLLRWDYNVIVVDWDSCSMQWNYVRAVGCVPVVGQSLGQLLDELQQHMGLVMENVYIIGHSLGAHIAGIAGKQIQNGQLHTIIALDPALPLFSIRQQDHRIAHQDAMYVEVIHTNGGMLGFLHPIGTADFYANGGTHQPGCRSDYVIGICSHARAWELFVESLLEPEEKLLASRADSLDAIQQDTGLPGLKRNRELRSVERVKMGGEPSSAGQAHGLYSITTRDKSPFFSWN
ncbi:phospholipase A1 VesT1.02-like [Anopheles marshallii]|uniref:phospholipase A1 VesT1.02-like n=1 Tax=Anopheles marshallii TaxID=1521116 RepID=UPI00237A1CD8|nr:phospholipase A1 VesT1.02-like [Anopheles marshallii]